METAGWVNVFASLAALGVVLAALIGPIARPATAGRGGSPRPSAFRCSLAIEPVRETLGYGQVNLLLFGLIIADLVALRWRARAEVSQVGGSPIVQYLRSGAWAGVGIGLATSIKLTPALFILYLLVTRQWRAALDGARHRRRRHHGDVR